MISILNIYEYGYVFEIVGNIWKRGLIPKLNSELWISLEGRSGIRVNGVAHWPTSVLFDGPPVGIPEWPLISGPFADPVDQFPISQSVYW